MKSCFNLGIEIDSGSGKTNCEINPPIATLDATINLIKELAEKSVDNSCLVKPFITNDGNEIWEAHSYVLKKASEKKEVFLVTVTKTYTDNIQNIFMAPIKEQFIFTDKNKIVNFLENKFNIKLISDNIDIYRYLSAME